MENKTSRMLAASIEAQRAAFMAQIDEIENDVRTLAYEADDFPHDEEIKFMDTALLGARQLLLLARQAACGIPSDDPANRLNIVRAVECIDVLVGLSSSEPGQEDEEEEERW